MDLESLAHKAECEATARSRYSIGTPASNARAAIFESYHKFYAPVDGDQWPEDKVLRPAKLHITANLVKAFVDICARILSIEPRLTLNPPTKTEADRNKAEVVEEMFLRFMRLSGSDIWLRSAAQVSTLYGVTYLKPFWNEQGKRPDVLLIEQPQNLMIGYGSNDYSTVDWAIYHYSLSPMEAMIRFPGLEVVNPGGGRPLDVVFYAGDHDDPLAQNTDPGMASAMSRGPMQNIVDRLRRLNTKTEYEDKQVAVWDYWYRNDEGQVVNAILVQGRLVQGPDVHTELPVIPYIAIEHDHEPGSPEGISMVEGLIPIQMGLNRVLSHYAQIVADNSGTAYQITGENADGVPEGLVPSEDEVIAAGPGNRIEPIQRSVQNFPMESLIDRYWDQAYKLTGIPEIAFGTLAGAETSGRAVAVQMASMANRMEPRRDRMYAALVQVLMIWGYMLKTKNPTIKIRGEDDEMVDIKVGDFIEGFDNWRIIPPEITPRDSIEYGQHVINLVQGRLLPLSEGMDRLGIESPEQMLDLIRAERSDPHLFPQDVQAYAVLMQLLQSIGQANMAQAAMSAQMSSGAEDQRLAAEQAGAPGMFEDQNMATPGGAPPPGASTPGGIGAELQPLLRQTSGGESQAMSQITLPTRQF
jgi:hypothetical protein